KTTGSATIAAEKPDGNLIASNAPPAQSGYTLPSIFKPNVPEDVVDLARQAKENFDKGKYRSAEKLYQEILTKTPNNLYSLSNLGITASQKGWQEAAEKELLEAISENPKYADAHFNLAVIYATSSPPSREQAKRHYAMATSLGAQPDAALEKLLH